MKNALALRFIHPSIGQVPSNPLTIGKVNERWREESAKGVIIHDFDKLVSYPEKLEVAACCLGVVLTNKLGEYVHGIEREMPDLRTDTAWQQLVNREIQLRRLSK